MLTAVAWCLVVAASLVAGYWGVVLVRVALQLRGLPVVRRGLSIDGPAGGWPKVSIVVPAHNEERVIESCIESLLASEYPALEVVLVLDRCTDRTLELVRPIAARDARLTVIENASCPEDWAGKCNAARVGAERATGAYLLFTDADVQFDPRLVRAALAVAIDEGRGLLSLLPTLRSAAWYEAVVQPVAALTLLRLYPIDKVNREERRRPFANGQFLLFERSVYERVGGHAAVKDDLLEDIAFARRVDAAGGRVGLAVAEELLTVHMYPSFAALRTGWKRIFIEACGRKVGRLRKNALRVAMLGVGSPLLQLAAVVVGLAAGGSVAIAAVVAVLVGLLVQAIALAAIHAASRMPPGGAALFPLGAAIVARVLWEGAADLAARRPVRWGGRAYVLTPRD